MTMRSYYLALTALASGLATALPQSSRYQVFTINNNFETLSNDVPLVGTVGAIGVYNLLEWNFLGGDAALKRDVTTITGVEPYTPPNIAGYGVRTALEVGTAYISSNYESSSVEYFDLYIPGQAESIRYGCNADTDSNVGIPASCEITATGYGTDGTEVAKQTFSFTSEGGLTQQMSPGAFSPDFVRLGKVEFTTSYGDILGDLGATMLDNVYTRVYQRS
ncbi:hypothetical protein M409DRAFT_26027 [Zasmidium cellare ATCC 36951]|uniref:Uncharacterized protein n=1 Tax=Zasmidium cellare ATCC 36951 TaxID=1080233 RepID=A0A6A6C8N9_ZASCE|nr:uncharacterized protein M409DRAFT_26027 [Zasmidium cellare ATCC 36951]KAF2163411.1 hypothetical protein M409DRAFT_26027 [Zasmidium cellare ATCC 36951]